MVKAVLSRAAAEDRPAAAYLLSGTRGVGKTTIARIFAKALNCQHAPGPEPCNQCEQCRKITQGVHVDVTEIDGASNNSVEDARSLRETIGYAPMEGRYKIFIIDEAHMLTRNAFNALLKTLEEPPERVVFIFATTEAHKFPITIVSRCQHFVFRHLSEDALFAHLTAVLRKENAAFEEGAVRLIARRAAGSVRDSMSLLDQALDLAARNSPLQPPGRCSASQGRNCLQSCLPPCKGRIAPPWQTSAGRYCSRVWILAFSCVSLRAICATSFCCARVVRPLCRACASPQTKPPSGRALPRNFLPLTCTRHGRWLLTRNAA